ncbi:MAG: zinc ribbon domain-containing protein, partial [Candidatus Odinarchaeota archaeon]
CGAEIDKKASYCSFCGLKANRSETKPKRAFMRHKRAKQPIVTTYAQQKDSETCINCGSQLNIHSKFCKKCGVRKKRCPVCLKFIHRYDDLGVCPECQGEFHLLHLKGTVSITGKCPACQSPIKESAIVISKT